MSGTAKVKKHEPITFDNMFSGDQAVDERRRRTSSAPITALMGNDYEKVDIDGIDLTIEVDRGAEDRDARARVDRRSSVRAPDARCR